MKQLTFIVISALFYVSCTTPRSHQQDPPSASESMESRTPAEPGEDAVTGQTIYVPVYSRVYIKDKSHSLSLSATLSIRNTDAENAIRVLSARYFDADGRMIREYIRTPLKLSPMAASEIILDEKDAGRGPSAGFVVEWAANARVADPVIEAVILSTAGQQGISFVSHGRVLKSWARP